MASLVPRPNLPLMSEKWSGVMVDFLGPNVVLTLRNNEVAWVPYRNGLLLVVRERGRAKAAASLQSLAVEVRNSAACGNLYLRNNYPRRTLRRLVVVSNATRIALRC